jgi:hypothetical protein
MNFALHYSEAFTHGSDDYANKSSKKGHKSMRALFCTMFHCVQLPLQMIDKIAYSYSLNNITNLIITFSK